VHYVLSAQLLAVIDREATGVLSRLARTCGVLARCWLRAQIVTALSEIMMCLNLAGIRPPLYVLFGTSDLFKKQRR
jgi:hypothetical protein